MKNKTVLLIYMEPTPYILGLLERLALRWQGGMQVWFAGKDLSQAWGELPSSQDLQLLPHSAAGQLRLLQRVFTARTYSLVHLAGWSGAPVFKLAMLLAAWYGVPLTVESDSAMPWQQSWYKAVLKRLCYGWLFRLPTHFFPGGRRQASYLQQYGVAESRITPAHMTVDVTALMARRAGVDGQRREQLRAGFGCGQNDCLFLYVGRLEPHKGLQELFDAFELLRPAATRARLLVVGSGSLLESLQRRASASSGILCSGRLAGEALLDAYAAADALVLPSRFEPWGLVVNEAMAAGLPVVVSDRVGCTDDLVVEGETGFVVPAESPMALEEGLRRLLDQPELRLQMGREARSLISGWTLEHEADIIVAGWNALVRPL